MKVALAVSERSTCDRKHVGCVIVQNNRIKSTGYNGSIPGDDHCDNDGHLIENNHCIRTIHAEQNALLYLDSNCENNLIAYTTSFPCWNCFKLLLARGIKTIKYLEGYNIDYHVLDTANKLKVILEQIYI